MKSYLMLLFILVLFSSCGLTETRSKQLIQEELDKEVVTTAIRIGKWNLSDSGENFFGMAVSSYSQLKLLEKKGAITVTVSLGPKKNLNNFTAQDVINAVKTRGQGKEYKLNEHRDKIINVMLTPAGISKYKLSRGRMGRVTVASFQSYKKQKLLKISDLKVNLKTGTATCSYQYEIAEVHPLYTLLYGENKILTGHASFIKDEQRGWILN